MRIFTGRLLSTAAAITLMLSACGGDTAETGPAPDTAHTGPTGGPAGTAVQARDSDLGTILTDADGRTVYLFEADTDGASTCYDDCAASWPALATAGEPQAGDGVDASLLGTTTRDDGTVQVTYADHPLYHFGGDSAPGDTNGQEVGDVWYVVGPDGAAVE